MISLKKINRLLKEIWGKKPPFVMVLVFIAFSIYNVYLQQKINSSVEEINDDQESRIITLLQEIEHLNEELEKSRESLEKNIEDKTGDNYKEITEHYLEFQTEVINTGERFDDTQADIDEKHVLIQSKIANNVNDINLRIRDAQNQTVRLVNGLSNTLQQRINSVDIELDQAEIRLSNRISNVIPKGAVLAYTKNSEPTNYSFYNKLNGRYLRGSGKENYGIASGSNSLPNYYMEKSDFDFLATDEEELESSDKVSVYKYSESDNSVSVLRSEAMEHSHEVIPVKKGRLYVYPSKETFTPAYKNLRFIIKN